MKKNTIKDRKGVTLIALVVTIIILVILATITLNWALGNEGIFKKVFVAKDMAQMEAGREHIGLKVFELQTEKLLKGESCPLEYINENLEARLEGCTIVGTRGEPIEKIYVKYRNYQYEILGTGEINFIGDVEFSEVPDLIVERDKTVTGVEKVTLSLNANVEMGSIKKIVTPTGDRTEKEFTYEITQNGEYEFKAVTAKGIETTKKIDIQNIKEEGLDLTGLTTGDEISHNHIYENKYDDIAHWEQCIICNNIINKKNHSKVTIGNAATCDVYVNLGQEICSDGCGYAKQIQRLPHIRPSVLKWVDWNSVRHIAFQCERCGGGGSNNRNENHEFELNGEMLTIDQMKEKNINVHSLENKTCTICKINVELTKHKCYSNCCYLCDRISGPTINYYISQNKMFNGKVQIDLSNNATQSIYFEIDSKGYTLENPTTYSLYGGNYEFLGVTKISQNGNIHLYKTDVKLKDRNIPITEAVECIVQCNTTIRPGDVIGGYVTDSKIKGEATTSVITDATAPNINEATAVSIQEKNGWATSKQINLKGSTKLKNNVYISMYYADGTPVFEKMATVVSANTYNFSTIPNIGVDGAQEFTIKVEDIFGNASTKKITLDKIDSKSPELMSATEYKANWSIRRNIKFEVTDKGIGEVQIGFNAESDYSLGNKEDNKYIKTYNFTGDLYQDVVGALYLKDGLGNITTKKITIGKIDSTSPTITGVKKETGKVIIEANDINTKLNKEGSGITGYAISKSKEVPANSMFQTSNEFTIEKEGTYYIYVKDRAGNLSERYEM